MRQTVRLRRGQPRGRGLARGAWEQAEEKVGWRGEEEEEEAAGGGGGGSGGQDVENELIIGRCLLVWTLKIQTSLVITVSTGFRRGALSYFWRTGIIFMLETLSFFLPLRSLFRHPRLILST